MANARAPRAEHPASLVAIAVQDLVTMEFVRAPNQVHLASAVAIVIREDVWAECAQDPMVNLVAGESLALRALNARRGLVQIGFAKDPRVDRPASPAAIANRELVQGDCAKGQNEDLRASRAGTALRVAVSAVVASN